MKYIVDLQDEERFWSVVDSDVFLRCQSERLKFFFDFMLVGDRLYEEFCANPKYLEKALVFLCDIGDDFCDALDLYKKTDVERSRIRVFVKNLFLYVANEIDSCSNLIVVNGCHPNVLGDYVFLEEQINVYLPTHKALCGYDALEYKLKTSEYMIVYLHEFIHRFLFSMFGYYESCRRFFSSNTVKRTFVDVNKNMITAEISLYELIYQDIDEFIYDGDDASGDIQREMVECLRIEAELVDLGYDDNLMAEEYFLKVCELMIKYGMHHDFDGDDYFPNIKRRILFAEGGVADKLLEYTERFGLGCGQGKGDDSRMGRRPCLFLECPDAKRTKLTQSQVLQVVEGEVLGAEGGSSVESSPALRTL